MRKHSLDLRLSGIPLPILLSGLSAALLVSNLAAVSAGASPPAKLPQRIVAGYIPDYRMATWNRQLGPVTDLIYFGLALPEHGRFDATGIPPAHLKILASIQSETNCRLLLTVGGWNKSAGFSRLMAQPKLQRQFIESAIQFCCDNKFDGIDLDWEHPQNARQIEGYAQFLKRAKVRFNQANLLLTIAVAGWQDLGTETYETVDRVHLMAYDHEFPQATFAKSRADVERLIDAGCPPKKIVLGVPFYGRDKAGQARTYAELAAANDVSSTSSVIDGYACNSPELLGRKIDFIQEHKLGGIMIWELGQDAAGEKSLLQSITQKLNRPAINDR